MSLADLRTESRLLSLSAVRDLAGLTFILYAAGFIVVRARMNFLGVWSGLPIVNDRYLLEGGVFALSTVAALFGWAFLATVIAGLGWCIWAAARKTGMASRVRAQLRRAEPAAPVLALILAVALSKWFQSSMLQAPLGDGILLSGAKGAGGILASLPRTDDPQSAYAFKALFVAVSAAVAGAANGTSLAPRLPHWLRVYLAFLALLGAVLLPIHYASSAKDPEAPVAAVTLSTAERGKEIQLQGFLLLDTGKELVVHDGVRIISIARSRVQSITVLCQANLLALRPVCKAADGAAGRGGAVGSPSTGPGPAPREPDRSTAAPGR